jgi:hypothetical protein
MRTCCGAGTIRTMKTTLCAAVACVASVSVYGVGCEQDCAALEPAYAGAASDEAWRVMLDARADADSGADAATFTVPAADDPLPANTEATFSWTSPLKLADARPVAPQLLQPRRRHTPLFERLATVVFPVAHAHLPPITSDIYLLEVDVPGRTCPVSALTTELSFTFPSSDWEAIVAATSPPTARLLSAFLTENRVTEGAFVAEPVTFTVEP